MLSVRSTLILRRSTSK